MFARNDCRASWDKYKIIPHPPQDENYFKRAKPRNWSKQIKGWIDTVTCCSVGSARSVWDTLQLDQAVSEMWFYWFYRFILLLFLHFGQWPGIVIIEPSSRTLCILFRALLCRRQGVINDTTIACRCNTTCLSFVHMITLQSSHWSDVKYNLII